MGNIQGTDMKNDFVKVIDRLSKVEETNTHQSKQLDAIYKTLLGNGQPGIVAEWNQWKGGVKFFGWVMGITISILGISVGILALVK